MRFTSRLDDVMEVNDGIRARDGGSYPDHTGALYDVDIVHREVCWANR